MCTRPDADSLTFMMSEKLLKEGKIALFCAAMFLDTANICRASFGDLLEMLLYVNSQSGVSYGEG